jgi:hypothetical protein
MTDRPIFLDVRDLAGRAFAQPGQDEAARSGRQPADAPDDQSTSRFRQAMAGGSTELDSDALRVRTDDSGQARPTSPFELFGTAAGSAHAAARNEPPALAPLCATIDRFVRRMTLADGQDGRRAVNIDLELGDAAVPGVSLSVLHDAGAWLAEFRCRQPDSYRLLAGAANEMAMRLAQALQSDALWRVIAEEGIAQSDWSDLAGVCDERGTVEAFCSAAPGGAR